MATRVRTAALYALIALSILALVIFAPEAISRDDIPIKEPARIVARISGPIYEQREIAAGTTALAMLVDASREHDVEVRTKEYIGLGTLVEKIGGTENGTDGKYWMYYVNGVFAPVGSDVYVVQDGDVIEWKFETSKE